MKSSWIRSGRMQEILAGMGKGQEKIHLQTTAKNITMRLKMTILLAVLCGLLLTRSSAHAARKVGVYKGIAYWNIEDPEFNSDRHRLDIFTPAHLEKPADVFVFIHGGSWNHGDKKLYSILGRNMARKGVVAVLINYRLTPGVMIDKMITDCATAVKWVYENIAAFNGNPERIVVSGHSAGGHLASSLMISKEFEKMGIPNPVKGCVLIDAFGLDLYSYLMTYKTPSDLLFYRTFTDKPEAWRDASPLYHIGKTNVPFLVLAGSKTYPPIIDDSRKFTEKLKALGCCADYELIEGKKHAGMIVQMFWQRNIMYDKILSFMSTVPEAAPGGELTLER
jgi:acetyl esterase/lipase